MDEFTILEENTGFIELNKSKFYSYVFHLNNVDEFKLRLASIKKQNSKAKHVVYAYKIGLLSKSCDDGEPKGTGGRPLLELLNKKTITNVGVIVVRYYGGTQLGAGRLLRCYLNSAVIALNKCTIEEVK